jgi:hypothetical protein
MALDLFRTYPDSGFAEALREGWRPKRPASATKAAP